MIPLYLVLVYLCVCLLPELRDEFDVLELHLLSDWPGEEEGYLWPQSVRRLPTVQVVNDVI